MKGVTFGDFTNLYSLQKTLRFELRPIGATLDNFLKSDILKNDQRRAESYKKVKKIIDEYHKNFIENSLKELKLDKNNLNVLADLLLKSEKTEADKKEIEALQLRLRNQIVNAFKGNSLFARIDKKELIREDLLDFVNKSDLSEFYKKQELTKEAAIALIEEFKNFTAYFGGFHENRKNMYTTEAKSTAIAYRLINDNLPIFLRNISAFEKIKSTSIAEHFSELYKNFEERMNVASISELFCVDSYDIALTQMEIDAYNLVINGKTVEGEPKIQGLNEYINFYNQQQSDKKSRLPKFTPLYKQILSDRDTISWIPEKFESADEALSAIKEVYQTIPTNKISQLLQKIDQYDTTKIFIRNDVRLSEISQKLFKDWSVISIEIKRDIKARNPQKPKEKDENYNERIEKLIKNADSFSLAYLNECTKKSIQNEYFGVLGKFEDEKSDLIAVIHEKYKDVEKLLSITTKDDTKKVKELLDSIKDLLWFIKPLLGKGDEIERDTLFYEEFEKLYKELNKITPLYDKVRNYMTKKPYSTNKIKINFENETLAKGWDVNKERDNTTILLRKNGLYYLAIMDKKHNNIFESQEADGNGYEKMEYKLLPGANKMLPKVFFSKSRIDEFAPSETLLENYKSETHKKGDKFNLQDCHNLIDFFKQSIDKHEDWKHFNFKFSDTNTYRDLSGFYREVEQQGYKITFRNISEAYVDKMVNEGKLYLFQIYNKDFSEHSKGTPNMHTLYWKALFEQTNLQNVIYKLNGEAELFHRARSISDNDKIVHEKNKPIDNKNENNAKKQSVFEYDIIKDKRYTKEHHFQFHVPITLNFKAAGYERINDKANEFIKNGGIEHIIGIDRGERHLLYLSLIDMKGNIVKQFSLNEIVNEYNGQTYKTDYHQLLEKREHKRDEARKSWQTIENIKELKEGYISQVIHKIAQLIAEYKAIVVMEDLNFGFKRSRQKVEKQVYQKFEKMLIDKLNYLVDKKKAAHEIGGLFNAYQLTNKFDSFAKMGKQNGFLFYIPAWNTSKIDPVTGFVNMFDTRYEKLKNAQNFFDKFADIRFNKDKDYFEFVVDNYSSFNPKAAETRQDWTICTYGNRINTFCNPEMNNQWDNKEVDLTDEFKRLFDECGIDYLHNLKQSIINQTEKAFFYNGKKGENGLLQLFKLTVQMRNSITNSTTDYMISPVADKRGNFYDSRTATDNLPDNADANGAYNIARKGLCVVEQIRKADDLGKLKIAITDKEWLQYVQKTNN